MIEVALGLFQIYWQCLFHCTDHFLHQWLSIAHTCFSFLRLDECFLLYSGTLSNDLCISACPCCSSVDLCIYAFNCGEFVNATQDFTPLPLELDTFRLVLWFCWLVRWSWWFRYILWIVVWFLMLMHFFYSQHLQCKCPSLPSVCKSNGNVLYHWSCTLCACPFHAPTCRYTHFVYRYGSLFAYPSENLDSS